MSVKQLLDLIGKVAFITGGSRGLVWSRRNPVFQQGRQANAGAGFHVEPGLGQQPVQCTAGLEAAGALKALALQPKRLMPAK